MQQSQIKVEANTQVVPLPRTCEDCESTSIHAKGRCHRHYLIFRRSYAESCKELYCDEPRHAHEMCSFHYQKWRAKNGPRCGFKKAGVRCKKVISGNGLCMRHREMQVKGVPMRHLYEQVNYTQADGSRMKCSFDSPQCVYDAALHGLCRGHASMRARGEKLRPLKKRRENGSEAPMCQDCGSAPARSRDRCSKCYHKWYYRTHREKCLEKGKVYHKRARDRKRKFAVAGKMVQWGPAALLLKQKFGCRIAL